MWSLIFSEKSFWQSAKIDQFSAKFSKNSLKILTIRTILKIRENRPIFRDFPLRFFRKSKKKLPSFFYFIASETLAPPIFSVHRVMRENKQTMAPRRALIRSNEAPRKRTLFFKIKYFIFYKHFLFKINSKQWFLILKKINRDRKN